jgi:SOS-response transcriptional repressor LexA
MTLDATVTQPISILIAGREWGFNQAGADLTSVQRETLDVLANLAKSGNTDFSFKFIADELNLQSVHPLQSRMKHLQEKRWIYLISKSAN